MLRNIFPDRFNNQNLSVLVDDEDDDFVRVRWMPLQPQEDMYNGIIRRINESRQIFENKFIQYGQLRRNQYVFASAYIEHVDRIALVGNRTEWGCGARITTVNQFDDFERQAEQSLDNLFNSNEEIDIEDIVIELNLFTTATIQGGTKMVKVARDAIKNGQTDQGLAIDISKQFKNQKQLKNQCGWIALLQALVNNKTLREKWIGDLSWLDEQMNSYNRQSKFLHYQKRLVSSINRLKNQLEIDDDFWEFAPHNGQLSTIQKIIEKQQNIQIVIFNNLNKHIFDRQMGDNWQWDRVQTATVYLEIMIDFESSSLRGHIRYINSIRNYFDITTRDNTVYYWCDFCVKRHSSMTICEGKRYQCDRCGQEFFEDELLQQHKQRSQFEYQDSECEKCHRKFHNQDCLSLHRCIYQWHVMCEICGKQRHPQIENCQTEYICKLCKKPVKENELNHQCYIVKPRDVEILDESNFIENGQKYYAFDVESILLPADKRGFRKHKVNFINVQQCFTNNSWNFQDLGEFFTWMFSTGHEINLIAHNLKGYDGRLIFEELVSKNIAIFSNTLWRGSKILKMEIRNVRFLDSVLHLPASLEQLPKMFNMDETQFKKGFFPYEFNTIENQNYVGTLPDIKYYRPDQMKKSKLAEFHRWYSEQEALELEYDFQKELREYCQSDVKILKQAIETYYLTQLKKKPIDPWQSLTIASYALKMYRQFYMPENLLGALNPKFTRMIKPSMHGGRTDARVLLREWSQEDVAQGIYGKYQDVQSLYPTVQFYDDLPVGTPIMQYNVHKDHDLTEFFGFIKCDIEPTKYLHHPVIVDYNHEKQTLLADLTPKTEIVLPSPELHLALENGYVIKKIHWLMHFEKSNQLFKNYFREFLKDKIQASGIPGWVGDDEQKWEEFAQYHEVNLGINLEKDKMRKNPSLKTGAKLLCNSLWGKFAETAMPQSFKCFRLDCDISEYAAFQSDWIDGKLDVKFFRRTPDHTGLNVLFQSTDDNLSYERLRRINLAIASMITSHARCRLWKEMNKLGDRVLYHDTDSIIYEYNRNLYNIPEGRYLGEWECETGGDPIVKFTSIGPKSYAYVVQSLADGTQKEHCKMKGITLTAENSNHVNYLSMKQLILQQRKTIKTSSLLFKYIRPNGQQQGSIQTGNVLKEVTFSCQKGIFNPENKQVYPFGSEKFLPELQKFVK